MVCNGTIFQAYLIFFPGILPTCHHRLRVSHTIESYSKAQTLAGVIAQLDEPTSLSNALRGGQFAQSMSLDFYDGPKVCDLFRQRALCSIQHMQDPRERFPPFCL